MKKYLFCSIYILASSVLNAEINCYGPSGPHTALKDIADLYTQKTGIRVNVYFGPQAAWFEQAKEDADILFGSSEQSAIAIARDFEEHFSIDEIKPLYFREAIILTQKGNPLQIRGLRDLAEKKARIVVPEGLGESNTSGTGMWEDMIGRTKDIKAIQDFRRNIVAFVPNSESAKKLFAENRADAWITWMDWIKSNPDIGTAVQIEKDLVVYRVLNIVAKEGASDEVQEFINYLTMKEAREIFEKYGWQE